MHTSRVQVLLSPEEKEAFRRLAKSEGLSLSAWLRGAGRERLEAATSRRRLCTADALRRFFEECDEREKGHEPDWHEHLDVIRRSRLAGESGT